MKNSHLVSGFIFRLFLCPAKEKKILDAKMDIFYNYYIIIMVNLLVMMRELLICKYPLSFWTEALFPVRRNGDEFIKNHENAYEQIMDKNLYLICLLTAAAAAGTVLVYRYRGQKMKEK